MSKPTYDELQAHAQAFYDALMRSENIGKSSKEMISGIWSCMNTPAACLAQVRADAGRAGFVAGACALETIQILASDESIEDLADDYSDRILQGGQKNAE